MTVAIAAMCGFPNGTMIIGAEDHMVTSGDIEFEQPQPKMWRLSPSCAAMFFGLSAAQAEVAELTETHVRSRNIASVRAMADCYAWFLRAHIRREAETDLLAPLNLTVADLNRTPPAINAGASRRLSQQMQMHYEGTGLAETLGGAIVVGSDATGAHIFKVEHGRVISLDNIGFVAAGGGEWHAESQFMFSKYTRHWSFPDALSLVYAAKKRAEVAPGVGNETDLVVVTTNPANVVLVGYDSPLVRGLDKIYQEYQRKQEENFVGQRQGVKAFVDDLLNIAKTPQSDGAGDSASQTQAGQPISTTTRSLPSSKRGRKRQPPPRA